MKNKQLRDSVDKLDDGFVFGEIAAGIDLASADASKLTRGEQWKVWLDHGDRTTLDLIKELEKAPGKPQPGERIGDAPVPYYKPGPVQYAAHQAGERVILVAGGWRAGKSKWLAAQLLPYMFRDYSYVWIVANDYKLAREEFNYIQMWLKWLDVPLMKPPSKPKEGGWQIVTKWNAVLETMTGKDDDKIEMANLNACGIAEAGQTEKELLTKVRGRVMQKRGRIFISGSMVEAQPWYVNALKQYKNGDDHGGWRSFSIPSFDNLAVYPAGREDPEIKLMEIEMPEDEFARKVLAEPMPPTGLVFQTFDPDTHVVPMRFIEVTDEKIRIALEQQYSPFSEEAKAISLMPQPIKDGFKIKGWEIPEIAPVEIAVDPGYDPGRYVVLACVRTKDGVLVFDEVCEKEKTGEEVIQICMEKPWWPRVRKGTIDIAAKQHQMNMSEHEKWQRRTGLSLRTVFVPVTDGISRYREFLKNPENGQPRMWIDPRCDNFIWEHGQYRYPKLRDEANLKILPIDRHNHAIKAFTYYLIVNFKFSDRTGGTTARKYIDKKQTRDKSSTWDWMFSED